ncbi:hypothetical protein [Pseudomonas lactucae]|uniref:Uncharacterized protein n=1 Tax=Pseudomonas lactucae TaxID=2813360 RepID=A0A9X1C4Q9_9PSED|nr:hypothetical protein [Pseudomonas lactucae]MBN2975260.1 hypothetical protein [Pseudomonas lactucae]MBN2989372.1 hypothetical protein [Pseudomonas lactucae]
MQEASSTLGEQLGRLPAPVGNISQLLMTLLPRFLKSDATPLEDMIRDESRKALLAHIANASRQSRRPMSCALLTS